MQCKKDGGLNCVQCKDRSRVTCPIVCRQYTCIAHTSGLQLSGELPPLEVKANLLEKFSEAVGDASSSRQGKRKISRKMKDKILLHLLVLTLILDDFSVDCSVLQQDLKLTTKKSVLYRDTGMYESMQH